VPAAPPRTSTRSPWQGLASGARYAWGQPSVRALLLAVAGVSLFGRSYTQLMPVFARDVLAVGPGGLGLLLTMPGLGTILAALGLATAGAVPHKGRWLLVAAAALAVAGCGGSGGLSAKDYRAKADAICANVKSQRERLPSSSNYEELVAVARSSLAINTAAYRRFKALKPSGDLKAPHSVMVTRMAEGLKLQQKALSTNPRSPTMRQINLQAATAHRAFIAAAREAKLSACLQI
jgi:hypothetical protein